MKGQHVTPGCSTSHRCALSFLVAKTMLLSIAQPPSGPSGDVMVAAGSGGGGGEHDTSGEEQQDTR